MKLEASPAQTVRHEINIYDVYKGLDKIVYKINFTENKALIMNWFAQSLKDLNLTIISSKIRLRHQSTMPERTIWDKLILLIRSYY